MTNPQSVPHVRIFVSYSHKDIDYRETMESNIALLLQGGGVQKWSDQDILAGQSLSSEIQEHMDDANVFVFLISPDFIASKYCRWEWEYAAKLEAEGKTIFRIPIILRTCPWPDMVGDDDVKALPDDGRPVSQFEDKDLGWKQVYDGIKAVIERIGHTHTPRRSVVKTLNTSDFLSQSHLKLQDLFVFLRLSCQDPQSGDHLTRDNVIHTLDQLLTNKRALIYGPQNSGKTALMRHIFLSLLDQHEPVIYIDGNNLPNKPHDVIIKEAYAEQFEGDYDIWRQKGRKRLVMDNLTADPRRLDFVDNSRDVFDKIYVVASTETYLAYFQDDDRLAEFRPMRIETLTRAQQEKLIRKRLELSENPITVTDGYVDQIENEVNSIILSERIFPRYPFYVLSILQSYEAYMPTDLAVTSFGYCYHVLIVANLMRSGISGANDDVGAAFNFAEHLAFETYRRSEQGSEDELDLANFIEEYRRQFHITTSIISRLKGAPYGLIDDQGCFRTNYMYYYFLGKYLARNTPEARRIVEDMCEHSHRESNHLTLLFLIHHTSDDAVIDDILIRTMCSLDHVTPAKLDPQETIRFVSIVEALPKNILTNEGVDQIRQRERNTRQELEAGDGEAAQESIDGEAEGPVNGIYRILKNNRIMSQVLRNKHGRLARSKVEEVVTIISDSGLRLINLMLEDEDKIAKLAVLIHENNKEWSLDRVKRALEFVSFVWAITNIEDIVSAINVREIRASVRAVVERGGTPAHDLIGYFSQLDTATELTREERAKLTELLKKHEDAFIKQILSMRTQHYMNTHRSPRQIEQAVCSLLKIKYTARLLEDV